MLGLPQTTDGSDDTAELPDHSRPSAMRPYGVSRVLPVVLPQHLQSVEWDWAVSSFGFGIASLLTAGEFPGWVSHDELDAFAPGKETADGGVEIVTGQFASVSRTAGVPWRVSAGQRPEAIALLG